MKNKRNYRKTAVLILLLLFGILLCPAETEAGNNATLGADGQIYIKNNFKKTLVYSAKDRKKGYLFESHVNKGKVKLSNKSVGKASSCKRGQFDFYPKKPGTTKVKIKSGKKTKTVGTIKVVKFKQPFKSFKIDGKSYRKQVKSSQTYISVNDSRSKIKVKYELKPGWKVAFVRKNLSSCKKKKAYTLSRGGMLDICVKNKKRGEELIVSVDLAAGSDSGDDGYEMPGSDKSDMTDDVEVPGTKEKLKLTVSKNKAAIGERLGINSNIRIKECISSDSSRVHVESVSDYQSVVVGMELGTATITAVSVDGQTAECQITVTDTYVVKGEEGRIPLTEYRCDTSLEKTTVMRAANMSEGLVMVGYLSLKNIDGYEIAYARSSDFVRGYKVTTISSEYDLYDMNEVMIQHLVEGETYYFKVRSYTREGNTKVCSEWSNTEAVTIRRDSSPSGKSAVYDYDVKVLNPTSMYNRHGVVLYIKTKNPDQHSIELLCDDKMSYECVFVTSDGRAEYTYLDMKYKTANDKFDDIRAVEGGYIVTVNFEKPGKKLIQIKESSMEGYAMASSFELDIQDYDKAYDAWLDQVIAENTDDTMNVHEKMTAICKYLLSVFRYDAMVEYDDGDDGLIKAVTIAEWHTPCFHSYSWNSDESPAALLKIAEKIGYEGVERLKGDMHAHVRGRYEGESYIYTACPLTPTGLIKEIEYIDLSKY